MAFAVGAGFSALSGAIFATKLGSVYPHSFNVMISINILCVIIVGGMGSIPGVIVGAAALVGLPELLREFAEYRLLVYGAVLVAMMLLKPEGLWPEATRQRELHEAETTARGGRRARNGCVPADRRILMAVITTKKLTKQFGGLVAIDSLDLEVEEHSIHSVIGPNGAGKTTLFNCITGFYRPEIGEILLDERSLVGLLPDQIVQRGHRPHLPEHPALFQPDGHGEHPGRPAQPPEGRASRHRAALAGHPPGGKGGATRRRCGCSSSSAWPARATCWPRTCPTATSGAWRSRAPSPRGPRCCCWTSRPPA